MKKITWGTFGNQSFGGYAYHCLLNKDIIVLIVMDGRYPSFQCHSNGYSNDRQSPLSPFGLPYSSISGGLKINIHICISTIHEETLDWLFCFFPSVSGAIIWTLEQRMIINIFGEITSRQVRGSLWFILGPDELSIINGPGPKSQG